MLNIEDSLLILIDFQEKLVNAAFGGEQSVTNASRLSSGAKILDIPLIITEQYPKGLGNTVTNISTDRATLVEKSSFSAFGEEIFNEVIKNYVKKQVIICGIETHICVLQTAIDFINNGYEVYVVGDACSSRNVANHNLGLELLKQYGVKITGTEIVLFQWLKTSKHPQFKQIQALIK